jgi:hypothetical protein
MRSIRRARGEKVREARMRGGASSAQHMPKTSNPTIFPLKSSPGPLAHGDCLQSSVALSPQAGRGDARWLFDRLRRWPAVAFSPHAGRRHACHVVATLKTQQRQKLELMKKVASRSGHKIFSFWVYERCRERRERLHKRIAIVNARPVDQLGALVLRGV